MAKILIIEDETVLGEMYADKLKSCGHKTILANDAESGMVLAKKEKPSLIILDMLLPKEDGISFLTRLRNDPDVGKTMVIVFSNYDVPETKAKAKELRAVDYLIKTNFTPQQIVERITFYLRK